MVDSSLTVTEPLFQDQKNHESIARCNLTRVLIALSLVIGIAFSMITLLLGTQSGGRQRVMVQTTVITMVDGLFGRRADVGSGQTHSDAFGIGPQNIWFLSRREPYNVAEEGFGAHHKPKVVNYPLIERSLLDGNPKAGPLRPGATLISTAPNVKMGRRGTLAATLTAALVPRKGADANPYKAMPGRVVPFHAPEHYVAKLEESFDDAHDELKELVTEGAYREASAALQLEPFDTVRQSAFYLPHAVLKENEQAGKMMQEAWNNVKTHLETFDRTMIAAEGFHASDEDAAQAHDALWTSLRKYRGVALSVAEALDAARVAAANS